MSKFKQFKFPISAFVIFIWLSMKHIKKKFIWITSGNYMIINLLGV